MDDDLVPVQLIGSGEGAEPGLELGTGSNGGSAAADGELVGYVGDPGTRSCPERYSRRSVNPTSPPPFSISARRASTKPSSALAELVVVEIDALEVLKQAEPRDL
jgi:hypothetical protein